MCAGATNSVMLISVHGDPLIPLGSIQAGGQNVYVREVAQALDETGWRVDVFTHHANPSQPAESRLGQRSRVVRLCAGRPRFTPKQELFPLLPRFRDQVIEWAAMRSRVYTAIHSNYWLSGWVGMQLKRHWGIPQFHTFHSLGKIRAASVIAQGLSMNTRFQIEQDIITTCDKVLATNPVEQELLNKHYQVPDGKIRVVLCGVNRQVFYPRNRLETRQALGLVSIRPIMFVGRFEFNKGLTVLLEAMARLLKHRQHLGKSVQLLVAGGQIPDQCIEPREQRELKRLVGVLGLDRHVKFLGPLSHPELARYFAAAEVTVVPSYYETFGLVALEAIACGSPVIASDVGGLSYTVSDGETGLLVPPGDIEALERALACVLENSVLLNHMRMRASQGLSSSFTWPEIARQLGEMYRFANLEEEASAYESGSALVACQ